MCTRSAENQRDIFSFLTEVKGNERPVRVPDMYDRFGRPLPQYQYELPNVVSPEDYVKYDQAPRIVHVQIGETQNIQGGGGFSFQQQMGEKILGLQQGGPRVGSRLFSGALPRESALPTPVATPARSQLY